MKLSLLCIAALGAALPAQNTGITLSNAVDGYVEVPYSPEIVPQSGMTVEAWVTYDESTLGTGWRYPTIMRQNRNAGQESFFLRVEANNTNQTQIRFLINANSNFSVYWRFQPGQLLQWTHLAGTYDGQIAKLYVNGMFVASANGSGPLRDQGDVLRIGKGSDVATPIEVWNGDIDEVRLWPYARTEAEIQSTMNLELTSVPGGVSTWNFNNNATDSSAGRHATLGGSVAYSQNTLPLVPQIFPGLAVGASTPGCNGPIHAAPTALPQVGNNGFGFVSHRGVPGSATICVIGFVPSATPLPLAGIDVWLDVNTLIGGFGAVVDPLGTARFDLPIPATAPVGVPLAVQFVAIDACGPQGLTASDALALSLLP